MTEAAEQRQPAPPTNATEARTALDARIADKAWGDRVNAGDAGAVKELRDLTTMIAGGGDATVAAAMAGILPDVPDSKLKIMAGTADMLRDLGFGATAIQETLSGKEATPVDVERARTWKQAAMKNSEWTKRYLSGDQEAMREMAAANIVLSSPVKKENAA